MTTAALDFADLENPAKFRKVEAVEVTQAHERSFPEVRDPQTGKVVQPARAVRVTDAELPGIAADLNRRIAATGHLMPLTVGHRNFAPDAKEAEQPPVAGFARNYRVGRVTTPDGRSHLAVLEDEYLYADGAAAALRNYPYRSLDFDVLRKTSEGTALLVRPPYIQMGTVVRYQAPGEQTVNDDFDPAADAEPYAAFTKHMAGYEKHPRLRCYMKKYAAEAMGPGNAAVPGQPAPYQADPAVLAEVAALRAQVAAGEAARLDEHCRRLLDPFKGSIHFGYDRELAALKGYADDAARGEHLKYMVDTHQPLPTGGMIRTYEGPVLPGGAKPDPNDPTAAPAHHDQVMAYVRATPGLSYLAAEAAVLAKK